LSNDDHVRAGQALARATGRRPVAFVASADHGHGHTPDGPYGFSEHSAPYDDDVQDVVRRDALGELAAWDPQRATDALADSLWQMLMLHGALGDGFRPELLSYEAPTYFGMLTAAFERQE
jgi:aromatic ring-opening dioxygenase LigB subunit